jgi:hypothetical protein
MVDPGLLESEDVFPRAVTPGFGWLRCRRGIEYAILTTRPVLTCAALEQVVEEVMAASPMLLEQRCGSKPTVKVFIVGQVMKVTKGQASPMMVNELLDKKLPG